MRKKITLFVAATMMVFALTACSKNESKEEITTPVETTTQAPETTEAPTTEPETTTAAQTGNNEIASAVDVLSNVWATYAEDEMFFAMGGDYENMVDNAPGKFNYENPDNLFGLLHLPEDAASYMDDAASLIHGMNANTFTSGAFHLAAGADKDAFVTLVKDSIANTQWMCGFPEILVVFSVNDEYVVYALGNADIVNNFKDKMTNVYGDGAVVLAEENIG